MGFRRGTWIANMCPLNVQWNKAVRRTLTIPCTTHTRLLPHTVNPLSFKDQHARRVYRSLLPQRVSVSSLICLAITVACHSFYYYFLFPFCSPPPPFLIHTRKRVGRWKNENDNNKNSDKRLCWQCPTNP